MDSPVAAPMAMAGDIISGLCRAAESILTAAAIAIGAATGLSIGGIF